MNSFREAFYTIMFMVGIMSTTAIVPLLSRTGVNALSLSAIAIGYVGITNVVAHINRPGLTAPVAFAVLHLELLISLFKICINYPKRVLTESKEVILDEILEVKNWSGGKASGGELSLADKEKK